MSEWKEVTEGVGCILFVIAVGCAFVGVLVLGNLEDYGECRAANLSADVCLLDPPSTPDSGQ